MPVAPPLRDASVVTARPVVPGPIAEYNPPNALTSGSQLDRAAVGGWALKGITTGKYGNPVLTAGSDLALASAGLPWPTQIDSGVKRWTSYRPNGLRAIAAHNILGNFGGKSSVADFLFRHQEYPANGDQTWGGNIGGYPGPTPTAKRPMWNNLLAIVWNLRVVNPTAGGSLNSTVQAAYNPRSYQTPVEYVPPGTASLTFKGTAL